MTAHGLQAAVAELVDEHAAGDAEDAQFGLFAPPASPLGQAKAALKGWDGVGRKPGARNRRTSEIVGFILARHRHPLIVLAEIAEANVFDLAAMLGCTPFEAMQEKRLAAIGLAPYVAAKITPEVIDNRQVIHLHLGQGPEGGAAGVGGMVQVLDPAEFERVEEFERAEHAQIERDAGGGEGEG